MAVQFRDYYETLGVSKTASDDEIKSAFRKLARKYHPDVAKDKKAAEEKFKQINEAYAVLSDPEKRAHYDRFGTVPGGAGFGSADFSSLFEDLLGGFFAGGGGRGRGGGSRGRSRCT